MSTETPILKPDPVSIDISSQTQNHQTQTQHPALSPTTNIDKPLPTGHTPPPLPAAAAKSQALQPLLEELRSPDSLRRATAAASLGRTADVAAVPALILALGDDDADVAREAIVSLAILRSPDAVEPLIAVLNNRDGYFHTVVRIAAADALGQLADLRAVIPLIDGIRDPIAEVSAAAIRALALLPDPRRLPALLEVIRNEHAFFLPTTRRAAVLGLAQIRGTQADSELKFIAANEWEDAIVRAAAIEVTRARPTPPPTSPQIASL